MKINKENYVNEAENCIKKIANNKLSTNQIRKILSLSSAIYDDLRLIDCWNDSLTDSFQYLKLRCVYESGRTDTVNQFISEANIITYLDEIIREKNYQKALLFCKYMEALVAYHKFYSK